MKRLQIFIFLAQLSLLYNAALLLSVTLNLDWAKPRAAGGQFETFPLSIRVIYFGMFIGMIFLLLFLRRHRNTPLQGPEIRLARILALVFAASTIIQLISRSPQEQTNGIPALLIAATFFLLSKRDLRK